MPVKNHKNTEQTASALSPATKPSWRFGGLTAAELMPKLQLHLISQDTESNWQLVWLNNDGRPVIGLLPKVSWSIHYDATNDKLTNEKSAAYKVIKKCRDACRDNSSASTTTYMSYTTWQDELIAYSQAYETANENSVSASDVNEKPSYHHGLIGFIGYDVAAHELSPSSGIELAAQPCAVLGHYDIYLTQSAKEADWVLENRGLDTNSEAIYSILVALISYLNRLDHELSNRKKPSNNNDSEPPLVPLILNERWRKNAYQMAFAKTQDYLQQGDCYQINLTQAWNGYLAHNNDNKSSKLIEYLPALHHNTQAPFAGYLHTSHFNLEINNKGESDFELLSCSPELFFTFTKNASTGKHHIRTKPIKGTMPRGSTDETDNIYKQQLINSEKDRAENVMIVDLLRNDLGKYAKTGSVKVPQLFAIETFSNVHHMVSTITAELRTDTHPLAVLFGSLPAGSITGTPKKRAVEIISELEMAPRGAYCGTLGYMNFDGSGQWNVLIRTLQATNISNGDKQVSLWAGGGITVASDCDAEYQECLDKVGNLLSVLAEGNISG